LFLNQFSYNKNHKKGEGSSAREIVLNQRQKTTEERRAEEKLSKKSFTKTTS